MKKHTSSRQSWISYRRTAPPHGQSCPKKSCSPPPDSAKSGPRPRPTPTTATGGSTFRAFFKNRVAVLLLVALIAVVAFAFLQPYLPGQVDPNLCAVDPATGIQYRNIAPGEKGFIWGSNAIGQDLWARIWAGARTSLTIAFFVALIEAVVGISVGVLWGYVRQLDFFFTELYNICDNVPSTIILILISYVAAPASRR